MGRPAVVCALALGLLAALGAAASSSIASSGALDDGCLVTRDVKGSVTINLKSGFVLGRFDQGQVTVVDPVDGDGPPPKVTGADKTRLKSETKTQYIGDNVRFRASGRAIIAVNGIGVYVSLVGKGTVTLSSNGFDFAGDFSVDSDSFCSDDDTFDPVPNVATKFVIGGTP